MSRKGIDVSEIREREEGLFTTQGLTRALCLTAFVTWIVSVAAFFLFAYLVLRGELDSQAWRVLAIGFYFGIPTLVSVAILWSWRRCRRCSRRLFSDARPNPRFGCAILIFSASHVVAILDRDRSGAALPRQNVAGLVQECRAR
jgi:hypothetical protein